MKFSTILGLQQLLLVASANPIVIGSTSQPNPVAERQVKNAAELAKSYPHIFRRQYSQNSTENQLVDGTPCRDLTLIFARGTFEPGNIGGVVGPPFAQALADQLGAPRVAVQGVDYPANVTGFLEGGDPQGSETFVQLVQLALDQCPLTKLSIAGYSQGAQLVHNAAANFTFLETIFVNSVVVFGDPDDGKPVGNIPADAVKTYCNEGDDICTGGYQIVQAHLAYGANASDAASFVISRAGLVPLTSSASSTSTTTTGVTTPTASVTITPSKSVSASRSFVASKLSRTTISAVSSKPSRITNSVVSSKPSHTTISAVSSKPSHATISAVSSKPSHATLSVVSSKPSHTTTSAVSSKPSHATTSAVSSKPSHATLSVVSSKPSIASSKKPMSSAAAVSRKPMSSGLSSRS